MTLRTLPVPGRRAIAAMARNRVIGKDGRLPWRLAGELAWVKEATAGGTLVMGRLTWESLGRPLPGRAHVVVSATLAPPAAWPAVTVVPGLAALDGALPPDRPVWIFGGATLYASLLPTCEELYLTEVDLEPEGDAWFPAFEHLFTRGEVLREGPGWSARRWVRV